MIVDDILFPLCARKRASVLGIIFKANMVWNKLKSLMENSKFVLMVSQKKGKKGIFPYSSHISLKVKMKLLSRVRLFMTPMDFSLPVSSVHGIFHVRILEWVAISFSRESSQSKDWTQVSHTAGRLYHLSYQGSHKVEWVAFSRGSSWPRDRTWVSCIAGRFFTIWSIREALHIFR